VEEKSRIAASGDSLAEEVTSSPENGQILEGPGLIVRDVVGEVIAQRIGLNYPGRFSHNNNSASTAGRRREVSAGWTSELAYMKSWFRNKNAASALLKRPRGCN
jgi:hypothetical protein